MKPVMSVSKNLNLNNDQNRKSKGYLQMIEWIQASRTAQGNKISL